MISNMNRAVGSLISVVLFLATSIMWFTSDENDHGPVELIGFVIVIILVTFGLFVGIKQIISARKGEPIKDELSKRVMQKASSLSFYITVYLWMIVLGFIDTFNLDPKKIIFLGILGMCVTFAICWLVFNFTGVKNE